MNIKHVVFTLVLVLITALSFAQEPTYLLTTFNSAGNSGYASNESNTVEKTAFEEVPIVMERSEIPIWSQWLVGFVIIFCFVLFCKYIWLSLELTEYNKWLENNQKRKPTGKLFYPVVKPHKYLLNFKKWTLSSILDPFTDSDFRNRC